ncbi:MAG: META domain-containing protein [Cyclobacteriaceae bacterium]
MLKISITTVLITIMMTMSSFISVKPSEEDLVGFWKVDQYSKQNENLPVENLNFTLQCSVEGRIGKFTGRTEKNFFSGLYEIKSKKQIELKGLMSTKYEESHVSKSFIESFQSVSEFTLEDDKLLLTNDRDGAVIVLTKTD